MLSFNPTPAVCKQQIDYTEGGFKYLTVAHILVDQNGAEIICCRELPDIYQLDRGQYYPTVGQKGVFGSPEW